MVSTAHRSIVDEIRDEIQLDNYYRKFDRITDQDYDFYDDATIEYDYHQESFE
jgi:hypothetical protein